MRYFVDVFMDLVVAALRNSVDLGHILPPALRLPRSPVELMSRPLGAQWFPIVPTPHGPP